MPALPVHANLDQLRHQAKDLLRAARAGDPDALLRINAVSDRPQLTSAQLALAREYGFESWRRLKSEVERREILTSRDLSRLRRLLAEEPELARIKMEHWHDHKQALPLGFVAMLRFDRERLGLPRELPGTGAVAQALIDSGAPVDGDPGDKETPLITAASYGDVDVAKVLIDAGADVNAKSAPDSGGVPGGSALLHAAVFGMTDVLDLLVAAGAEVQSLEEAAAAGNVTGWLTPDSPLQARIRALVFAADHQRLPVIDELIAAGAPVDAFDEVWGRQALRIASANGRPASVRRLLKRGADPRLRDKEGLTALDWCRRGRRYGDGRDHAEVEAILRGYITG
jgi:ankyrin repeat protein